MYPNSYKADFESVNEYLLGISWKLLYNKSKIQQEFYDEFVNIIQLYLDL